MPREDPKAARRAERAAFIPHVLFGYGLNYLIDIKHAVIVDVEPHPVVRRDLIIGRSRCEVVVPRTGV